MTEEKNRQNQETEPLISEEKTEEMKEKASSETEAENPEATASEGEPAVAENLDLQDQIRQLRLELDEYKNLYLRKAAEFENFKKRKQLEFQTLIRSAEESLIESLLPVLDDFDRIDAEDSGDRESLLQGVRLIRDKLWNALSSRGLQPIEAEGKPFDPELHEAIMQREEEGAEPNTVLEEHQRGYRLGDKVIRHSKVIVSTQAE
jgi:molecular chaperone GrpE